MAKKAAKSNGAGGNQAMNGAKGKPGANGKRAELGT